MNAETKPGVDESVGGAQPRSVVARIEATRIVKTFGRATVALRGVTVRLEAGGLTLIEGPNGSGKSTLLGVLGTVIRPNGGHVRYVPLEATWGSLRETEGVERVRAAIGWVSHETLAYPDLTGRQNVELAARLHGLAIDEAWRRVEERFELGAFARRPARTYSRGQRQRLALARALVHDPAVVLLDEPTTGLDRSGVARLLDVVGDEVRRGALVAVVSHEPELFAGSDRWGGAVRRVVLDGGRLVTGGTQADRNG